MKKFTTLLLSGALICAQAFAVSAEGNLISAGGENNYSIFVNEEKLDIGDKTVYTKGDQIMVPVRFVGEKLGFAIEWKAEGQGIFLDNGTVNTSVYIGADSYYKASSAAIGMSAPTALGAAPELKDGTTFVPANMFKILFGNDDAVIVKDNTITFQVETESQVQIPNPVKEHKTVEDAIVASGFNAAVPTKLPEGYEMSAVTTISDRMLQIFYESGNGVISYRTAVGDEDISGDYSVYESVKDVTIGGFTVTVKGEGETVHSAAWTNSGEMFALHAEKGLSMNDIRVIIENIK